MRNNKLGSRKLCAKSKTNTFKNWEVGSCMRNEKLIHSFKIKNKETTKKNKYEEKHDDTNTTT